MSWLSERTGVDVNVTGGGGPSVSVGGETIAGPGRAGGSALSSATGININLNQATERAIGFEGTTEEFFSKEWDKFLRTLGLKKDKKEAPDSTGIDTLIGALEEQTKKAEREKADLASRALMNTQARLARERRPGMDTKNKTILTSPLGVPTSLLTEPKKQTLLGA